MADAAALVKQFLHRKCASDRLNYYTLLGIEEFLDDRTTIAIAIESSIDVLRQADRQSDPQAFEQIVKLVRQARATLLDEAKKKQYDAQLKKVREKSSSSAHPADAVSEVVRLQAVLPAGDPTAPFSMSDFLKLPSADFRQETVAERHFALLELTRQSNPSGSQKSDSTQRDTPVAAYAQKVPPSRSSSSSSTSRELQAAIRRNRQRKNLIASGSILGIALAILGAGAWMFYSNQVRKGQVATVPSGAVARLDPLAAEGHGDSTFFQEPSDDANPNRMNLGFGTKDNRGKVGELPKLGFKDEPPLEVPNENNPKPDSGSTADEPLASNNMAPTVPSGASKPEVEVPSLAPNSPPTPAPPTPEQLEIDHKAWVQAMKATHQAILSRDFKNFETSASLAMGLARDDGQIEQTKRLDRLGQLLQKGDDIIRDALQTLEAGTEIAFGSTIKVAVVEAKQDSIIVKDRGKNQTYMHAKLPTAFLVSILDNALEDSPIDTAIRGVVYALDPRSSAATKSQAEALLKKAGELDSNFQGLNDAILGKYE